MHVPDGFLDPKTAVATAGLATAGLGVALRHTRRHMPPRRVPLMGLAAAFIFAAQMLNFPVIAGTSGHLMGGVLAAVLLGPSAAVVVMSAVLIVQCLLFSDGGITALGANVFNMAIVGAVGGYAVYAIVRKAFAGLRGRVLAAAFAGWCATVLPAICCAGELAVSGTAEWSKAFPAMAGVHMLIGLGEGLITALVVVAIARARPELLELPAPRGFEVIPSAGASEPVTAAPVRSAPGWRSYGVVAAYGLLISLGLAMFVSPLASNWPDGLERVAQTLGFEHAAVETPVLASPLPDYQMPGIGSPPVATAAAGLVGTLIAFVLALFLARVLVPKPQTETAASPQ